jgi:hypothetical protein
MSAGTILYFFFVLGVLFRGQLLFPGPQIAFAFRTRPSVFAQHGNSWE